MTWITERADCVELSVRVVPRAHRDEVQGLQGDALRLRLRAPPVEGQANAALVRFLADALDLPKSRIELVAGAKGRQKRVRVVGATAAQVRARLGIVG